MEYKKENGKFNGWEAFKKIQVIKEEGEVKVLLNGQIYMRWANGDQLAKRVAIAELYKSGKATQEELAEAFSIHINSVYSHITTFEKEGMEGLVSQRRGPKESWKVLCRSVLDELLSESRMRENLTYGLMRGRWRQSYGKSD